MKFGVLLSRDLFFGSKVTSTAGELGLSVLMEGDIDRVAAEASRPGCSLILVDLALPRLSVASLLGKLSVENRPPVVAFGAHVHTALLDEARAAGCDEVLPRSKFSATLPDLLKRYLK